MIAHGYNILLAMRKVAAEDLPLSVLETGFSLGRLVLSERKAQGYSQETLAQAAEVSRSTIVQIERGSPRVQFVYWLCVLDALGLLDGFTKALPVMLAQSADSLLSTRRVRR